MRSRIIPALACLACLSLASCGGRKSAPAPSTETPATAAPKDEIPPEHLDEVLAANLEGLGQMERLTDEAYARAVTAFRKVRKRAPDWIPGSINLAIALLNQTGSADEEAKQSGADDALPPSRYDEALSLL